MRTMKLVCVLAGALTLEACLPTGDLKTYATDAAKIGAVRAERVTECLKSPHSTWQPLASSSGSGSSMTTMSLVPTMDSTAAAAQSPARPPRLSPIGADLDALAEAINGRSEGASTFSTATIQRSTATLQTLPPLVFRSKLLATHATIVNTMATTEAAAPALPRRAQAAAELIAQIDPIAKRRLADGAERTNAILAHRTFQELQRVHEAARNATENQDGRVSFSFGASDLADLSRHINEAAMAEDFDAATEHQDLAADLKLLRLHIAGGAGLAAEIAQHRLTADAWRLAGRYLGAYFRNGRFIDGTVTAPKLAVLVPEISTVPGTLRDRLEAEFAKVNSYRLSPQEGGFVTRLGVKHVIAPYGVELNLGAFAPAAAGQTAPRLFSVSSVDFATIAADVTRIALEAAFDAINGLPTADGATGSAASDGYAPLPRLSDLYKSGEVKDAKGRLWYKITAAEMSEMLKLANQAETATGAIASQVVRGVNFLAINNEALAKVLETAISLPVRKGSESVSWCWFASQEVTSGSATASYMATQARLSVATWRLDITR